jgi:hypothetical protein
MSQKTAATGFFVFDFGFFIGDVFQMIRAGSSLGSPAIRMFDFGKMAESW